jgi:hypothetical protein
MPLSKWIAEAGPLQVSRTDFGIFALTFPLGPFNITTLGTAPSWGLMK